MVVEVAEWSKALDSGSSPKGRGFKSRPLHFLSLKDIPLIFFDFTFNLHFLYIDFNME